MKGHQGSSDDLLVNLVLMLFVWTTVLQNHLEDDPVAFRVKMTDEDHLATERIRGIGTDDQDPGLAQDHHLPVDDMAMIETLEVRQDAMPDTSADLCQMATMIDIRLTDVEEMIAIAVDHLVHLAFR